MCPSKISKKITRWVRRNQNKHPCQCGCGGYIVVKREHYKPSSDIPSFLPGHNLHSKPEDAPPPSEKTSMWDKLSPEDQQRRINQLKSFRSGKDNPAWKGGRRYDDNGYVQIRSPDHPHNKDGYVFEHRLVVEEHLRCADSGSSFLVEVDGEKYLRPGTIVHHIDEVKDNNEVSNLLPLKNQSQHAFIHMSYLPMEEKLRRISLGITHSEPLDE